MATSWVLDLFNIIQEQNGNLLTEQGGFYICLQEFDGTVWEENTATGNG